MNRLLLTLCASVLLAGTASAASCVVADPTGTPLNVRDQPAGNVIGTLPNGFRLLSQDSFRDNEGRTWTFVVNREGDPIGWVFRRYIRCR